MQPPPVQFTMTIDGKRLAYTLSGDGTPLVLVPNTFMHVVWSWRQYPEFMEGLAARFRMLHFNYRGHGMSTRGLAPDHSMADWLRDLETVIDAVGFDSAVLMGLGHSGHIVVRYTLAHPQRVRALILFAPAITMGEWSHAMMRTVSAENWELYKRNLIPRSATPDVVAMWEQAMRETQTNEEFQIAIREIFSWDLSNELQRLDVPTLVLHPRQLLTLAVEHSQRFAASIRGARFVPTGGEAALGNAGESLLAIDNFIASLGLASPKPPERNEPAAPAHTLSNSGSGGALTQREREVLRLIARGRSNQQIAAELVLSVRTVERHITNLYAKIGAHGKAEATAYAFRNSLT